MKKPKLKSISNGPGNKLIAEMEDGTMVSLDFSDFVNVFREGWRDRRRKLLDESSAMNLYPLEHEKRIREIIEG